MPPVLEIYFLLIACLCMRDGCLVYLASVWCVGCVHPQILMCCIREVEYSLVCPDSGTYTQYQYHFLVIIGKKCDSRDIF